MRDLISARIAAITRYSAASSKRRLLHHVDVIHVLPGDLGDRDIQDVQILAADQIQQQVQRTFEGIQDDFQRVRRNIQILRDLQHRLPMHHRQRHFLLLWRRARGWRIRVVREFGIHQVDIGSYGRRPRSEPRLQGFALSYCDQCRARAGTILQIHIQRAPRGMRRRNSEEVVYAGRRWAANRSSRRRGAWADGPLRPIACAVIARVMRARGRCPALRRLESRGCSSRLGRGGLCGT